MGIDYELIGKSIRARRRELRLTQAKLAERVGVSDSYITELERGKIKNPSLEKLRAITDTLQINLPRLLSAANKPQEFFLTEIERKLIELFRKLPAETQNEIYWEVSGRYKQYKKREE